MKKQAGILLASMMVVSLAAGCGSQETAQTSAATEAATTTAAQTQAETTTAQEIATAEETEAETEAKEAFAGGYRTGLAVVSSMGSSKDAGDGDGLAQVDSVAVAVVVDGDGKIVSCKLDTAQNKMGFTTEGKVVKTEEFKTKKELKDDYGMKAASGIGKEWYEQAEAMEAYVIGKTAEEIKGIAVDESNKPTDADLLAGVTVSIGGYKTAAVKAVDNAK